MASASLEEGLQLFKSAFEFFYDMNPSLIQTLETKANNWYHIETFLDKLKSNKVKQKL